MNSKKILHILPSLKFGGEERFLLDIYPFLDKDVDHIICSYLHAGEYYSESNKTETYKNGKFWIFVFRSKNIIAKILKPLLLFYYSYRAHSILKIQKPDIIISYTVQAAIALYFGQFFLSDKRKKFTWYLRIGSEIDHKSHLHALFRTKIGYRVFMFIFNPLIHRTLNKADYILSVSNHLSQTIPQKFCVDQNKFLFLPVCVNKQNKLLISTPTRICDAPYLITLGRLEYIKGFDFLIKTFIQFYNEHKNTNLKLFICGDGSERKKLNKLIVKSNLQDKIILLGYVKDVERYLVNAEACLISSRSEGFSKVTIEAMMQKTIVVAGNINCGPSEIISHNVNGLLFENENPDSLIAMIRKVLSLTKEEKDQLTANAFEKANQYSTQSIAETLNDVLKNNVSNVCNS